MPKGIPDRNMERSINLKLITIVIAACLLVIDIFSAIPTLSAQSPMESPVRAPQQLEETIVLLCPQSGRLIIGGGNFSTWRQPRPRSPRRNDVNGAIVTLLVAVGLRVEGPKGEVFYPDSAIVALAPGGVASVTLTWDGADPGPIYGNSTGVPWTVYVEGSPINSNALDTDRSNNIIAVGLVTIMTLPGDVDNNGYVDIFDAIQLANAFGSSTGSLRWNAGADINNSGTVDIFDAILLAGNFNRMVPP